MFIDNKYTKWYFNIMTNSIGRSLTMCEKHHIIPKSLGGNNLDDNIAKLTPREHFICHVLLTKMLTGNNRYKMLHAAWRLAHRNTTFVSSKQYETLKIQRSIAMTGRKNPGVSKALSGRKVPADVIAKRIATVTGIKRPKTSATMKGVPRPYVTIALTGRKQSPEVIDKRASALRGKPSGAKGRTQSDEERALRSTIMKGRISPKKGSVWSESRRIAFELSKKRKQDGK